MLRRPFSNVTLTSSFFTSGRSAFTRYSLSSSLMSTCGDHFGNARVSPLPVRPRMGNPRKNVPSRFSSSSSSLNGVLVVNVCIFILPFFGFRIEWYHARFSAAFVKSRPNLAVDKMREAADKVVALLVPEEFYAVGQWYENFAQTTDDEVRELLARSAAQVE